MTRNCDVSPARCPIGLNAALMAPCAVDGGRRDPARDSAAARAAWERSKALILDPAYDFVVLDELNIVMRDDTLPAGEVIAFLKERPLTKHIGITGRSAKPELRDLADLVTEFAEVKHPFKAGFKAQKGVEF